MMHQTSTTVLRGDLGYVAYRTLGWEGGEPQLYEFQVSRHSDGMTVATAVGKTSDEAAKNLSGYLRSAEVWGIVESAVERSEQRA